MLAILRHTWEIKCESIRVIKMAILFISYAHGDEQYRQELEEHLTML